LSERAQARFIDIDDDRRPLVGRRLARFQHLIKVEAAPAQVFQWSGIPQPQCQKPNEQDKAGGSRQPEPAHQAEALSECRSLLALLTPLLADGEAPLVEAMELFFQVRSHERTLLKPVKSGRFSTPS
jgi:hypothetical protein